jgi:molybdopterin-guanine dinucleotide biosynthesis protein A
MRVGVFLGGRAERMGGISKPLLELASGETIIGRTLRIIEDAGMRPVLLGPTPSILASLAPPELPRVDDALPNHGPLGALVALLERYAEPVIALAGDMPYVSSDLLRRLHREHPDAPILAPRSGQHWEPLCARYDGARVGPVARQRLEAGTLSLQGLLDALPATALHVDDPGTLRDWDTPEDVRGT